MKAIMMMIYSFMTLPSIADMNVLMVKIGIKTKIHVLYV